MKLIKYCLIFLLGFINMQAFANHNNFGNFSVAQRVATEASRLDSLVQNSSLGWWVKQSVTGFNQKAQELVFCENNIRWRHVGDCNYQRSNVLDGFESIEHDLYNTQYQYPNIYHQYWVTKNAVQALQEQSNPTFPIVQFYNSNGMPAEQYGNTTVLRRGGFYFARVTIPGFGGNVRYRVNFTFQGGWYDLNGGSAWLSNSQFQTGYLHWDGSTEPGLNINPGYYGGVLNVVPNNGQQQSLNFNVYVN